MPEIIMPETLKPETEFVFNLDLFLRVIPSIRVNDRIIRLDTIEHIGFGFPPEDEDVGDENGKEDAPPLLCVTFQSGNQIFFDQDEEKQFQTVLETAIKQAEEATIAAQKQQEEMMQKAAQDAIVRTSLNPSAMPPSIGRRRL